MDLNNVYKLINHIFYLPISELQKMYINYCYTLEEKQNAQVFKSKIDKFWDSVMA